jgi:hypothetical protein
MAPDAVRGKNLNEPVQVNASVYSLWALVEDASPTPLPEERHHRPQK